MALEILTMHRHLCLEVLDMPYTSGIGQLVPDYARAITE